MLSLHKNEEELLKKLNYFVSSVETLANKTIADTLTTVDLHEQVFVGSFQQAIHLFFHLKARMEYDMSRYEWDNARRNPNAQPQEIDEAEKTCNSQLEKYNQLKADVRVKLTLLEENRIKVYATTATHNTLYIVWKF